MISKTEAVRRCTLDFPIDQDACDHERYRVEPSQHGWVWLRCRDCGIVIDERPRCEALTLHSQRCLGYAVDGLDTCSVHTLAAVS